MDRVFVKIDRKAGIDCSFCRNAETRKVGRLYSFVCKLGRVLEPCDQFKDARKSSELPTRGDR